MSYKVYLVVLSLMVAALVSMAVAQVPNSLLVHYGGRNLGESYSYGLVSLDDVNKQLELWRTPPISSPTDLTITKTGLAFFRDNVAGGIFAVPMVPDNSTTIRPVPKLVVPLEPNNSTGLAVSYDVNWVYVGMNSTVRRYSITTAGPSNTNFVEVIRFTLKPPPIGSNYEGKIHIEASKINSGYLYFGRFMQGGLYEPNRPVFSRCLLSATGACANGTDTILYNKPTESLKCSTLYSSKWFAIDETTDTIVFTSCPDSSSADPAIFYGPLDGSRLKSKINGNWPSYGARLATTATLFEGALHVFFRSAYEDSVYMNVMSGTVNSVGKGKNVANLWPISAAVYPSTRGIYIAGFNYLSNRVSTKIIKQGGIFSPSSLTTLRAEDYMVNSMIIPPEYYATNISAASRSGECSLYVMSTDFWHRFPQMAKISPANTRSYLPTFERPIATNMGGNFTYDPTTGRMFWMSYQAGSASKDDGSDLETYDLSRATDVNTNHPIYIDMNQRVMYYLTQWNGTINARSLDAPDSDPGTVCIPKWCCGTYAITNSPVNIQRFWIDRERRRIVYAAQAAFRGNSLGPQTKTVLSKAFLNCTLDGFLYDKATRNYYDYSGGFVLGVPLHSLALSRRDNNTIYSWVDRSFDKELVRATLVPPTINGTSSYLVKFTPNSMLANWTSASTDESILMTTTGDTLVWRCNLDTNCTVIPLSQVGDPRSIVFDRSSNIVYYWDRAYQTVFAFEYSEAAKVQPKPWAVATVAEPGSYKYDIHFAVDPVRNALYYTLMSFDRSIYKVALPSKNGPVNPAAPFWNTTAGFGARAIGVNPTDGRIFVFIKDYPPVLFILDPVTGNALTTVVLAIGRSVEVQKALWDDALQSFILTDYFGAFRCDNLDCSKSTRLFYIAQMNNLICQRGFNIDTTTRRYFYVRTCGVNTLMSGSLDTPDEQPPVEVGLVPDITISDMIFLPSSSGAGKITAFVTRTAQMLAWELAGYGEPINPQGAPGGFYLSRASFAMESFYPTSLTMNDIGEVVVGGSMTSNDNMASVMILGSSKSQDSNFFWSARRVVINTPMKPTMSWIMFQSEGSELMWYDSQHAVWSVANTKTWDSKVAWSYPYMGADRLTVDGDAKVMVFSDSGAHMLQRYDYDYGEHSSIETSSEFWSDRASVALASDPDIHRIYFTGKNDTTIHFFDLTDDHNGLSRPAIATFFDTLSINGPLRGSAISSIAYEQRTGLLYIVVGGRIGRLNTRYKAPVMELVNTDPKYGPVRQISLTSAECFVV